MFSLLPKGAVTKLNGSPLDFWYVEFPQGSDSYADWGKVVNKHFRMPWKGGYVFPNYWDARAYALKCGYKDEPAT